jgi:hypothetical protein
MCVLSTVILVILLLLYPYISSLLQYARKYWYGVEVVINIGMDLGHWEYPHEFEPEEWVGFVYRIIDNTNGMQYIGKKQLHATRRKKVKGRKNRKRVVKESNWREYTGSSKWLNEAIEKKGIEHFTFLIESLHETKVALHYREVQMQMVEDVLRAMLPNGDPAFYNGMVGNMRFKLKDETPKEAKHSISKIQQKRLPNKRALKEDRDMWTKKYLL